MRHIELAVLVLLGFAGCSSSKARLPEESSGKEGGWAYDYSAHGPYYVQLNGVRRYVVSMAGVETLTNKRVVPRVVEEADGVTVVPTTDNAEISYQSNTQPAGTLTINADKGVPADGQQWTLKIRSKNVQTYSWDSMYVGGSSVKLPTTTSGGGKIDYITFVYDAENSKWDCIQVMAGY